MANKYNIGDTVTVTATVVELRIFGTVLCKFNAPDHGGSLVFGVQEKDIATHTPKPRPIQVGDKVKIIPWPNTPVLYYLVVYIDGEYAWIKREDDPDLRFTVSLNRLERI